MYSVSNMGNISMPHSFQNLIGDTAMGQDEQKNSSIWDWRWPETGRNQDELNSEMGKIVSPYDAKIPPICYPGTTLPKDLLAKAGALLEKQINAIGSHTHGVELPNGEWQFKEGEGCFETIQRMEAQVIWMIASMMGGTRKTVDGYFCGGGTEANLEGMWIGREYLRRRPDPMNKGIVILTSPLYHYSITKSAAILDLGYSKYIPCNRCHKPHIFTADSSGAGLNLVDMDEKGQMNVRELEKVFYLKYNEGFRRFLIVPSVGTYLMGSIDPIQEIGDFITRVRCKTDANFYMHVDASFAGFTIPFVNPEIKFGFSIPEVMSITIDGDKMGRLPYPAGVFLCRKTLMSLVAREVNYVRGNEDNTISGSRSGIAQILAWYLYQSEGVAGQRKYVQSCLDGRDRLVSLIALALPWIKVLPCSPWVNFAPMEIDIADGEVPKKMLAEAGILGPYHLRSDFFCPGHYDSCPTVVYKVCIMPHNLPHIDQFVADLVIAKNG